MIETKTVEIKTLKKTDNNLLNYYKYNNYNTNKSQDI